MRSFCVATIKPFLCAAQRASPLHIQDPRRTAHSARYAGTGAPPRSNKRFVPKGQRRRANLRKERETSRHAGRCSSRRSELRARPLLKNCRTPTVNCPLQFLHFDLPEVRNIKTFFQNIYARLFPRKVERGINGQLSRSSCV